MSLGKDPSPMDFLMIGYMTGSGQFVKASVPAWIMAIIKQFPEAAGNDIINRAVQIDQDNQVMRELFPKNNGG